MGPGWQVGGGGEVSRGEVGWEVVAVSCRAGPGSLQVYF